MNVFAVFFSLAFVAIASAAPYDDHSSGYKVEVKHDYHGSPHHEVSAHYESHDHSHENSHPEESWGHSDGGDYSSHYDSSHDSHLDDHSSDHSADYHAYPKYSYEYGVKDAHTGDHKSQWETRDGDSVKGEYTLDEADGTKRVVSYHSDGKSGFHADVKRIGHAHHEEPHYHHEISGHHY